MTEIITSKPSKSTCKECGVDIFWVTMGVSQKKMPIDTKRITIINKVKDNYWTTTSGYSPHWGSCPRGGIFRNENDLA